MTKCKICGLKFVKRSIGHKTCRAECALLWVEKEKRTKADKNRLQEKRETKRALEKLKTRSDYTKEAQFSFNAYIRARDKNKLCICCDKPLDFSSVGGNFDCGHYRSVGSAPHLRFNPDNAHGQTKKCNRYGAGRAVDYRKGLLIRIGKERLEYLENNNDYHKWTKEELIDIKNKFLLMKNELLLNR